jgi:hypothetical protein
LTAGGHRFGAAVCAALVAGCASGVAGAPGAPPAASAASERRLLATLAPGSEPIWRNVARELASLHGVELLASWHMASLGEQCLVLEAPAHRDPAELARRIAHHPRVTGASVVGHFRALADAADPYLHLQSAVTRLRLIPAQRWASGRGVTVAVVDTGLDLEHPELAQRVTRANDFVGRGGGFTTDAHGTAVAGVLAARAGNGVGIVGVAPQASLWALKACWPETPSSTSAVCDGYTLAQALDAALAGGVDIVNLSLTGDPDALLARLVGQALRQGTLVVAAAEGSPPGFPASIPGVLAVHSWRGPGPIRADAPALPPGALTAPGVDVLTTVPHGGFDFLSGSSLAAAQASGVAALVLELRPKLPPAELVALLRESAALDETATADGVRILDACGAVGRARGRTGCDDER